MATTPQFYNIPHDEAGATATVANTNLDGTTGTYVTVATGAANGSEFDYIDLDSQAAVTEGWVRFWKKKSTFTILLWQEYIPPVTQATKVASYQKRIPLSFGLESASWSLIMATHTGDDFHAIAHGFDK